MKKLALFSMAVLILTAFTTVDLLPTSLKITVRNELGNIEEGAEVQLFATDEDYRNEENPVSEVLITNKKGEVKFKDLEPKVYYVMAKKGDKNNWGAGVQTDILEEGKMNKVTIVIE